MATIVAFSVPDRTMGEEALERLDGVVDDVALVYRNKRGAVRIEQSSDLTVGKGVLRGGLLGAAVSIFAGPLVGMTAAGGALGAAYGALRDKGVDDRLMKLAGRQLEMGQAAVFVLAAEDTAERIVRDVESSGMDDVEVSVFPAEAEGVVKEVLKLA